MGDGAVVEAEAFRVPKSGDYPKGIKYSFQYYDAKNERTMLRYDNYGKHAGSRHHKHLGEDETQAVKFESLQAHFKKFMREVRLYGREENP